MFEIASLFAEFQGWLQDDIGSAVTGSAWTSQALDWAEVSGDDSLTSGNAGWGPILFEAGPCRLVRPDS